MDKARLRSDGVMLVGRVKWHTDFAGKIESGLFKMMAIGLGKFAGAQRYHSYAYKLGLEHVIRSVGRQVLKSGKISAASRSSKTRITTRRNSTRGPRGGMEQERRGITGAGQKSWMATNPRDLDILILDEIGKNISGAGMDTKVVNRGVQGEYNPWPNTPRIERIFVRDLSSHSYGNAAGVGLADIISDRLLQKIDLKPTWINALTASTPTACRIPIHYPTDRECLEAILPTMGKTDRSKITIGWIQNSLELNRIELTENLLPQIKNNPELEVIGPAHEMAFDAKVIW